MINETRHGKHFIPFAGLDEIVLRNDFKSEKLFRANFHDKLVRRVENCSGTNCINYIIFS